MARRPTGRRSVCLSDRMVEELQAEARRQDRTLSWLVQQAWTLAREQIQRNPSVVPEETSC